MVEARQTNRLLGSERDTPRHCAGGTEKLKQLAG